VLTSLTRRVPRSQLLCVSESSSRLLVGSFIPGQPHASAIVTVPAPSDMHNVSILWKHEAAAAASKVVEKKRETTVQEEVKDDEEQLTVVKEQLQQSDDRKKTPQQQLSSSSELVRELQEKDVSNTNELADRDRKLQTCRATISEMSADRGELESLNDQIRQKDTRIRELETLVLIWDREMEKLKAEKEKELCAWREKRDALAADLGKPMREKDRLVEGKDKEIQRPIARTCDKRTTCVLDTVDSADSSIAEQPERPPQSRKLLSWHH